MVVGRCANVVLRDSVRCDREDVVGSWEEAAADMLTCRGSAVDRTLDQGAKVSTLKAVLGQAFRLRLDEAGIGWKKEESNSNSNYSKSRLRGRGAPYLNGARSCWW